MASESRNNDKQQKIRLVLMTVVGALLLNVVIGFMLHRKKRLEAEQQQREQQQSPVTPPNNPATNHSATDASLVRAKRTQAVDAIESGDYTKAVEILSGIIRSGDGTGDETELLRIAKELEEKRRKLHDSNDSRGAITIPPLSLENKPAEIKHNDRDRKRPTPTPPPAPRVDNKRPSPTPAPAETNGRLLVLSIPSGLTVEVDGKTAGTTPVRATVAMGAHQVTLWQGGRKLAERRVQVNEADLVPVDMDVRDQLAPPAPAPASTAKNEEKPVAPIPSPAPTGSPPVNSSASNAPAKATPAAPVPTAKEIARPSTGATGEIFVSSTGLPGEIWINGKPYGPTPVLAKGVAAGSATVELRVDGVARRSLTVVAQPNQRATVKFR